MKTIRDKCFFEIFEKKENTIKQLDQRGPKQISPPRSPPALSVVIRGVPPAHNDDEIQAELHEEDYSVIKCIRIMCREGPTFMVRVLSKVQETIDDLLMNGHKYMAKYIE